MVTIRRMVTADAPLSVPAIKHWTPGVSRLQLGPTRVFAADGLEDVAELLVRELRELGIAATRASGDPQPGDIALGRDPALVEPESYRIVVGEVVELSGATDHGVFNATRTLLQWLTQTHDLPRGVAVDRPDYEVRSVLIDNVPRALPLTWWENLFRIMAWYKLNDANLYVDGPGVDADFVRALQRLADRYFIKLVCQLNMPAHLHVLLASHPEYQLRNADGSLDHVALDLTNERAVDWALGLLEQCLQISTADEWHLGSDEFPGWPGTGDNHPQLAAYAREKFGDGATFADLFADFQNRANAVVKRHGKRMRVWNDMVRHSDVVQLDRDVTVEYWTEDENLPGELSAAEIAQRGNPLINANVQYLYYDQSRHNLDPKRMWEGFRGSLFSLDKTVDTPLTRGARLCVWLAPIGTPIETDAAVLHNIVPSLQVFAERMWTDVPPARAYASFAALAHQVGLPAGLHPDGDTRVTGRPAVVLRDTRLAYAVRDERGGCWVGEQVTPGSARWTATLVDEADVPSDLAAELQRPTAGEPVVGTDAQGQRYVFTHSDRGTLRVEAPGHPEWTVLDLAESQTDDVAVITDGLGRITWLGATTFGTLEAGTLLAEGVAGSEVTGERLDPIVQWRRETVVGRYAYPGDGWTPAAFRCTRDGQAAPTSDGRVVATELALPPGPCAVVAPAVGVVGFARSDAPVDNYFGVYARDGKVGFTVVSDGRQMPDGAWGEVDCVLLEGDRLGVTLVDNWLIAYAERDGVWDRVHSGVVTSLDDLRDPEVRQRYCAMASGCLSLLTR